MNKEDEFNEDQKVVDNMQSYIAIILELKSKTGNGSTT